MPPDQKIVLGLVLQMCANLPQLRVVRAVNWIVGKIALIVVPMQFSMPLLECGGFSKCGAFLPGRGQPLIDKIARRRRYRIHLLHRCALNLEMTDCLMRVAVAAAPG